jgi:hypothetical protein
MDGEAIMSRLIAVGVTISLALSFLAPPQASGLDKPASEKEKIEALIKHVEGLKDAKFVRNDREYDAATAARFMRGKWDADQASIKTAKDFIEKAGSVSSTTGKPYLIRFKDGKEKKSGEYLLEQLMKLEGKGSGVE